MSEQSGKAAPGVASEPFDLSLLVPKMSWGSSLAVTFTAELPDSCTNILVKSVYPSPEIQCRKPPTAALIELAIMKSASTGCVEARNTWSETVHLYNSDYVPDGIRVAVDGRVRMTLHPVRERNDVSQGLR